MSVLESVLLAIRFKRQEAAKSVFGQYFELVDRLAQGEQVDVDELAIVLDQLDKDDSALAADVQLKKKRFELATQLDESRNVAAIIPSLQQKSEAAKVALERAIAKLRPIADEAAAQLHAAELRQNHLQHVEPALLNSVMDPQLLDEQAKLDSRRNSLAAKIIELQEDVSRAQFDIRTAESNLEVATANLRLKDDRPNVRMRQQSDAQESAERLSKLEHDHRPLFESFSRLKASQAELDAEQAKLNRLKFVP